MGKSRRARRRLFSIDQGFMKAMSHETRVKIMAILTERVASPNELATILGEGLSQVSYHVKVLKEYERIELVRTEPRRGAVEHYYQATTQSLLPAKSWRGLRKGLRTVFGGGLASELFNDLADALKTKRLAKADSHISRLRLVLDAEGRKNVTALAERFAEEAEDEQRAARARAQVTGKGNGGLKGFTIGVLAFEDGRDVSLQAERLPKDGPRSTAKRKDGTRKAPRDAR